MIRTKNKIIAFLLLTILIIGSTGCRKTLNYIGQESKKIITNTDVTLSIKENTLTNTEATLILKNNSNEKYLYGDVYAIEVKQDDKWYELTTETIFNFPSTFINAYESTEIELNWENVFGKLKKGTYRIIKNLTSNDNAQGFNIAVEFSIK